MIIVSKRMNLMSQIIYKLRSDSYFTFAIATFGMAFEQPLNI
jgi:hypothetical protein